MGLQSARVVKLAAGQPKQNQVKWVALRRLLIKAWNDSYSLQRIRKRKTSILVATKAQATNLCLSCLKAVLVLQKFSGLELWAGFLWLSSRAHCPLCRAVGQDRATAVWSLLPGAVLLQPTGSGAACSPALQPIAVQPQAHLPDQMSLSLIRALREREVTVCRWLVLRLFMCLRIQNSSVGVQNFIPYAKNAPSFYKSLLSISIFFFFRFRKAFQSQTSAGHLAWTSCHDC